MAKKKSDAKAATESENKTDVEDRLPGGAESVEEISAIWRAVLCLPKDFPMAAGQITMCMALADMVLEKYRGGYQRPVMAPQPEKQEAPEEKAGEQ